MNERTNEWTIKRTEGWMDGWRYTRYTITSEHAIHIMQKYILFFIYLMYTCMHNWQYFLSICYVLIWILNIYENKFILDKTNINLKSSLKKKTWEFIQVIDSSHIREAQRRNLSPLERKFYFTQFYKHYYYNKFLSVYNSTPPIWPPRTPLQVLLPWLQMLQISFATEYWDRESQHLSWTSSAS